LTLGGRAGIDLRTLQELAGHSSPILTARYSHRRLHDLAGAVEKLPRFLPDRLEGETLRATGTDPACTPLALRLALPPGISQEGMRTHDNSLMESGVTGACHNPLTPMGVAIACDSMKANEKRVGDGTRTHDLQIHSLPL